MVISEVEVQFLIGFGISILAGLIIGFGRELRGKEAGMRTMSLVICGAMLFTFLSLQVDSESKTRIAAQIVTGIGFLGAGIIFHKGPSVRNLTTAATVWIGAAIGMALGFEYYFIGIVTTIAAFLIPLIPDYKRK
jgi:putative Mg2+ transporter-C (MgtC) family protein